MDERSITEPKPGEPDQSVVPQGAEKYKDERKDAFMDFDEKNRVRKMLAKRMGPEWDDLDWNQQEKLTKIETANIITEIMTMAGGLWGKLSHEEQRMLFHGRFIDETVAPEERQAAFEGKAPASEEFPSPEAWMIKNKEFLFGMTDGEKKAAYKRAYTKAFTKAREKK